MLREPATADQRAGWWEDALRRYPMLGRGGSEAARYEGPNCTGGLDAVPRAGAGAGEVDSAKVEVEVESRFARGGSAPVHCCCCCCCFAR